MDDNQTEIQESAQAAAPQETPEVQAQPVEAAAAPAQAQQEAKTEEEQRPQRKRSFQDRIDTLTRRAREAEERAAEATRLLEEFRKPVVREQYPSEDAYFAEVQRRQFMEAAAQVQSQTDRSTATRHMTEVAQANAEQWREAVEDAIKRIPDWTEVVSKSTARTTPEMEDAIKESEFGPEIAYYLAKHPREAERIYNLSPKAQDREIVRLEARVSASGAQTAPVTKPSATPPINPISSSSTAKLSDDEEYRRWAAERNKQNRFGSIMRNS